MVDVRVLKHGFTLIELLVAMSIVIIVLLIGVPSYTSLITSNRVSSEANALMGDLQFARASAIKQGNSVTLCPANAGATACSPSTTWTGGWIAIDSTPNVLRKQASIISTDTLIGSAGLTSVTFNKLGFASTTGSVTVTPTNGSALKICIYTIGQVKVIAGGVAC